MSDSRDDEDRTSEHHRRFHSFLTKLVRVPKREIDEQEAKYQQQRELERGQRPAERKHA